MRRLLGALAAPLLLGAAAASGTRRGHGPPRLQVQSRPRQDAPLERGPAFLHIVGRQGGRFDARLQKSIDNRRLSLLAGIYPIESGFSVLDSAGIFVQRILHPGDELTSRDAGILGLRLEFWL